METRETAANGTAPTPGTTPVGVPATVDSGGVGLRVGATGAVSRSSEEERRKWREKGRLARARKKVRAGGAGAGDPSVAPAGAPLPVAVSPASAGAPGIPAPVAIPWDPSRLRRLWEQLIPHAEKWDVDGLKNKAHEVDSCLVEMVDKEAKWNPVSKAALIESGPYCTKDILDACGIGAEQDHWASLIVAGFCIYSGRSVVADRLEKMLREKVERENKTKASRPAGQQAGESQ